MSENCLKIVELSADCRIFLKWSNCQKIVGLPENCLFRQFSDKSTILQTILQFSDNSTIFRQFYNFWTILQFSDNFWTEFKYDRVCIY